MHDIGVIVTVPFGGIGVCIIELKLVGHTGTVDCGDLVIGRVVIIVDPSTQHKDVLAVMNEIDEAQIKKASFQTQK